MTCNRSPVSDVAAEKLPADRCHHEHIGLSLAAPSHWQVETDSDLGSHYDNIHIQLKARPHGET
jgi:hypothetical protein